MSKKAGKAKTSKSVAFLLLLFIGLVGYAVTNLFTVFNNAEKDRANLELLADLRALSFRVPGLAQEATDGDQQAFSQLATVVTQMEGTWSQLRRGSSEVDPSQLNRYQSLWRDVKQNADTILADQETIVFLNQVASTLNQNLPELQREHTQIVEILLERRAPSDQVAVAQAQSWRAERIGRNVDKMLVGSEQAEAAADQFNRDANLFGRVLEGMKTGDTALGISRVTNRQAQESLGRISSQFEVVSNSIQEIFEATPALFRARQALRTIQSNQADLLASIATLSDAVSGLPEQRVFSNRNAVIAGGGAFLVLAVIGVLLSAGTRTRLRETAETNERNQEALLRLLDEMAGLGEGDLSREATVTEDFTGHIADAFNLAIQQLRELVSRIQDTAENVSASANETRATALQLSESSEHQAQEIAGASAAINEMAITIDQVSANAAESAAVADRSVSIAAKGGTVVQNTITGMDTIREQIQDTSKRIKRLGESSQEIGDIVSLINDIADQTNILALNAAIQASMAGDAGRGFAVVADEVQRLAERSAGATKQIASLVNTIQTDTNEAVSSMEQTTSEVVKGAQLAHDAGDSLEEIQTVSANLAELIQDISTAARHQATTAGHISNTMNVIQDITSQTLAGTNTTATSVGELAEMAVELRESVSGFKLPDSGVQRKSIEFDAVLNEDLGEAYEEGDVWEGEEAEAERSGNMPTGDALAGKEEEPAAEKLPEEEIFSEDLEQYGIAEPDQESADKDRNIVEFDISEEPREQPSGRVSVAEELEAELAGIDLDEFEIDLEPEPAKGRA